MTNANSCNKNSHVWLTIEQFFEQTMCYPVHLLFDTLYVIICKGFTSICKIKHQLQRACIFGIAISMINADNSQISRCYSNFYGFHRDKPATNCIFVNLECIFGLSVSISQEILYISIALTHLLKLIVLEEKSLQISKIILQTSVVLHLDLQHC